MISAEIIAHSISESGKEIVTFELEYNRYVHSEFMTHRVFSRNAASSRAIPVKRVIRQVWNNPAVPTHWGKNQPGMQARQEVNPFIKGIAQRLWRVSAKGAATIAWCFDKMGVHKQVVNRLLEPFQYIKVVMTTTELENFFWLRNHPDAQPEIKKLAREMYKKLIFSEPNLLKEGEWHLPYVFTYTNYEGEAEYWNDAEGTRLTLEEAKKVSASCCAQVSYRMLNTSLEKAEDIQEKLIGDGTEPVHASPFEHLATPISEDEKGKDREEWSEGITHMDKEGALWSGNFKGWLQHRQLVPGHVKW